jgi:hypothetical protein
MFCYDVCSIPLIISDENFSEFIASTKRSVRPTPHHYLFVNK